MGVLEAIFDDFISQLATILSSKMASNTPIAVYHDGSEAGFVGRNAKLASNEQFAKLMNGELVLRPDEMDNFMRYTLPSLPSTLGSGLKTINIENLMPMTINGNLDKSVLPDIKSIADKVVETINKAYSDRGVVRTASAFQV